MAFLLRGNEVRAAIAHTGRIHSVARGCVALTGRGGLRGGHRTLTFVAGRSIIGGLFSRVTPGCVSMGNNCYEVVGANPHHNSTTRVTVVRLVWFLFGLILALSFTEGAFT